ncbi:hypothetical protein [Demequina sp. NBRC 110055]|uniref:hypothetical protein n=1 Tax=Demequina sp. NBRC 110055 TaxID=1570344 RepID=UPI0011850301|nr:hypothetical protein [Demequina sp. NBRC 110055]
MADFAARLHQVTGELEAAGVLESATGLAQGDEAEVIDPEGRVTPGAGVNATHEPRGLWLLSVEDESHARHWATRLAWACGASVELRPAQT